ATSDLHPLRHKPRDAYTNPLASRRSQTGRYQFRIPSDAKGPITFTARVNYRRFDQHFMDFAMGKDHYPMPIVEMVARTRTFELGDNPTTKPDPVDNPLWIRW